MKLNCGLDIQSTNNPLGFVYGIDCYGPTIENRRLDDIRKSLLDKACVAPEIIYSIAMDVGKKNHQHLLSEMMLLFGMVIFEKGKLGSEPVRSQGHIHAVSTHSGWSPPEVYQILNGNAIIYMQETAETNPGKCFAVNAKSGDIIIVPPNWAHATISTDPDNSLIFCAWCDREYSFLYDCIREKNGLAWQVVYDNKNALSWKQNSNYVFSDLTVKNPENYLNHFGIESGIPLYEQFEKDPQLFNFVSNPVLKYKVWKDFIP